MHKQLELLITLHDLDLMISEISEMGQDVVKLGFSMPNIEDLQNQRDTLMAEFDRAVLVRYEALRKRYGRPVVPVTRGVCHGCFTTLPTSLTNASNTMIAQCENCGRFLYWLK
jgi:hypothetical protein